MLDGLFGSKNRERILLFLFVNHKCYGTQLQTKLKTPLTPIQKTLQKLEKHGILESIFEGKTRIYQFNPLFPYLEELEALLKRAYALLPSLEKKKYLLLEEKNIISHDGLERFWEILQKIKSLQFQSKSHTKQEGRWEGQGSGKVIVFKENDGLIFEEKGLWFNKNNEEIGFSNIFRWTLDRKKKMITLEHLRFGRNQPVFLCHLVTSGLSTLVSLDSHLCEADAYFGKIFFTQKIIRLHWRIIGPKKNEEIDYFYQN